METNSNIGQLIRRQENIYITGTTVISKYVNVSQYEDLNKIDAYLNSKHTSGETDSMGREKPFFNISVAARNIWYRATDIDRKQIKVRAVKSSEDLEAFLATVHLQNWMRREYFGTFLNNWGLALATYGSTVSKFVEKDGKLHSIVVPWNRIICDTVDFENNPVIEKIYLTPAQLKTRKGYDQDIVKKLLETRSARKDLDKQNKDVKNDYIELYEIHGELPLSYLTGKDDDEHEYQQQMQVVTFIASKDDGKFDDFVLVKGKEKKSPYLKDDLIPLDGQTLSIGAIQNLFESQWMVNHTAKAIKDQLDLASKLIFQTSDGNFVGQNALASIESGDILIHAVNAPLTKIANDSHDITSLHAFSQQWQTLGNQINGISEAMTGQNQPAGSAWRQTQALLQESHSLFELMTENKGLAIERMLREFIIPYLKKQMDTGKEIAATLDSYHISQIDSTYVKNEAFRRGNKQMIDTVLSGEVAPQANFAAIGQGIQGQLNQQGNQRFFKPSDIPDKTWKELFKDLEWDLEVDITGEQRNVQEAMTTLNTLFAVIADPMKRMVLQTPEGKFVFNKILELSGEVSAMELASIPPTPPAPLIRPKETMNYKDLPAEGQVQMAAQAGIQIQPPQPDPSQQTPQAQPQPVGAK